MREKDGEKRERARQSEKEREKTESEREKGIKKEATMVIGQHSQYRPLERPSGNTGPLYLLSVP